MNPSIITAAPLPLDRIKTLVFAGGGNRCWWQAGLIDNLLQQGWKLPPLIVGTSAGAAIAASFLTNGVKAAMANCMQQYQNNKQLFDWKGLLNLRLMFAHQHMYPDFVRGVLTDGGFEALRHSAIQVMVSVTHPAMWLGLRGSLWAGTLAYLIDKKIAHSIHPKIPKLFGLKQAFYSLNKCRSAEEARQLLTASAAAAPFISARKMYQQWMLDGGYTDNAPIPPHNQEDASKTLVLLTRHYPKLPQQFNFQGRYYWQPSRKIPVSTWDCRPNTPIEQAFELGRSDAG